MGVRFTVGSTDGMINTTFGGITPAYPFTVGSWVNPLVAADGVSLWGLFNSANNNTIWQIQVNGTTKLLQLSSGTDNLIAANALTLGQWYYVVGRFISATNRRMTILEPDLHAIESLQSVVSNTPGAFTDECVGAQGSLSPSFSTGIAAEMFRTDTDIQSDGAALLTSTLLQLAYKGPWSISSIVERIVWYKSLLRANTDVTDTVDDPCFARNGRAGWSRQTSQPQMGPHPPLASDYVYLNTLKQKLMA